MAQKIVGYVRFQVPAGKATPAPLWARLSVSTA